MMALITKKTCSRILAIVRYLLYIAFRLLQKFWGWSAAIFLVLVLIYWLYGGVLAASALLVAIAGLLYNASDYLLFAPDTPPTARIYVQMPAATELHENLVLQTPDNVKLHAYFLKQEDMTEAPTILYAHGNAGNIGYRLPSARELRLALGCNVFLLEWRGYGKSEGSPSEQGLYIDLETALLHLHQRMDVNKKKIILFGRSLGGGVALHIASEPHLADMLAAVVVENTFTSIPDVARMMFNIPPITVLPDWMHKNQFKSVEKVTRIRMPILFMSGLRDQIIPPRMMTILYETCASVHKKIARFNTGSHQDTWVSDGYMRVFIEFVKWALHVRQPIETVHDMGAGEPMINV